MNTHMINIEGTNHPILKGKINDLISYYNISYGKINIDNSEYKNINNFPVVINNLNVGDIVYLDLIPDGKEDLEPVPFMVINKGIPENAVIGEDYDGECDGIWLLSKDVYVNKQYNYTTTSDSYFESDIDEFLNGEFLKNLDRTIVELLLEPYIECSYLNSLLMKKRAFLLSFTEYGESVYNVNEEGKKMSYFNSSDSRIVNSNDPSSNYFTRTKIGDENNNIITIRNGDGVIQFNNETNNLGIRPALILPKNLIVQKKDVNKNEYYLTNFNIEPLLKKDNYFITLFNSLKLNFSLDDGVIIRLDGSDSKKIYYREKNSKITFQNLLTNKPGGASSEWLGVKVNGIEQTLQYNEDNTDASFTYLLNTDIEITEEFSSGNNAYQGKYYININTISL